MKKIIVFVVYIVCMLSVVYAQNIVGRIIDEEHRGIGYANVILLREDSTIVSGGITDDNGCFNIDKSNGAVMMSISFVGYEKKFIDELKSDMGTIQMQPNSKMLNVVEISSKLPVVKLQDNALVTDVAHSVLSKMGTAGDVLGKIPGMIKKDDSYEVIGKGAPLIYINDRKLYDLSELDQLNANEISYVEVIMNPGAEYDATVQSVVKIKTIKKVGEGWGVDVRSGYYQSMNVDLVEQVKLNYRKNKFDLFGSLYYTMDNGLTESKVSLVNKGTQIWTHEYKGSTESTHDNLQGNIGMNYQINDNHIVGVRYDMGKDLHYDEKGGHIKYTKVDGIDYDCLNVKDSNYFDYDFGHDINAYYNGKIGKVDINFNADYFQNGKRGYFGVKENSERFADREVNSISTVKNSLAAGKLVVSFPLWKGDFALGSELTYTYRKDDYLNVENYIPTVYCKIDEMIATGFAEYNCSFSWGDWSLGLRYEHAKFDYFENDMWVEEQSRKFDNLFPNISFTTQLGPIYTMLSYTVKTERPDYYQLSNKVTYIDRYSLQKGNPTLLPTIIHDVTWVSVWEWLQLSVSYSQYRDWILNWGTLINEDGSLTMLDFRNGDKPLPKMVVYLSASPKVGCWTPIWGVGLQKQWLTIDSYGEPFDMSAPMWMVNLNNSFELPWGIVADLDISMMSKGAYQNLYMEHASGSADLSISKSFLKDALMVKLKVMDLFDTDREYYHVYSGDYNINQINHYDRRMIMLDIRYKFNVAKSRYKGVEVGRSQRNRM